MAIGQNDIWFWAKLQLIKNAENIKFVFAAIFYEKVAFGLFINSSFIDSLLNCQTIPFNLSMHAAK